MAAGAVGISVSGAAMSRSRLRAWYYALPDDVTQRVLSEQCERTLVSVVETFLGVPVETAHYLEFFRWRAEHVPGHGIFYERIAARLDGMAHDRAGCRFAECDGDVRRAVIAPVHRLRDGTSRLRLMVFGREWVLLEHYIAAPVFELFVHTDAWIQAGYESWPGQPTGLDAYLGASATHTTGASGTA